MEINGAHIEVVNRRNGEVVGEGDSVVFSDMNSTLLYQKEVMWPWVEKIAVRRGLSGKDVDLRISSKMIPITLLGSTN